MHHANNMFLELNPEYLARTFADCNVKDALQAPSIW